MKSLGTAFNSANSDYFSLNRVINLSINRIVRHVMIGIYDMLTRMFSVFSVSSFRVIVTSYSPIMTYSYHMGPSTRCGKIWWARY